MHFSDNLKLYYSEKGVTDSQTNKRTDMQLVHEVYAEPLEPIIVVRFNENENEDKFNVLTEKKVKRTEKRPTEKKTKNKKEGTLGAFLLESVALMVRTIAVQHEATKLSKLKAKANKCTL